MNGRDSQEDRVDYQQRARQPIGPEGFERRRGFRRQGASAARGGQPFGRVGAKARAAYRGPGAGDQQATEWSGGNGGRSRLVAVLVLLVAAVIVTVGGIAATSGDAGSGAPVSISILPFPNSTDTTIAQ